MKLKSAWVFGCGYLGLRLVTLWLAAGVSVTVMTRSAEKASTLRQMGVKAVVSAPDGAYVFPREAPDAIVWAVGFAREQPPTATRKEAWVGGLQRLGAELARRGEAPRVIYVSTTGVYGDAADERIDESIAPEPRSEGGRVALDAESVVRTFSRDPVAIRLAGIIGPGRLLQKLPEIRRGMIVRAPAEHWLNLVHVDDAAQLVDVVARHENPATIINAAMLRTPTRREYYEGLAQRLSAPLPRFEPTGEPVGNRRVASVVRPTLLPFRHEGIAEALDSMVG